VRGRFQSFTVRAKAKGDGKSELERLAEEAGGLGIVVVAPAGLVSGAEVEVDGGVEIVLGVKVEPLDAGGSGVLLDRLHESVGEAESAEGWADVETLDLGGIGNLRQGTEHDASGGSRINSGDPDGRVGTGEVIFEGGAVVAHKNADGLVVFLDESEGRVGLMLGSALDGEVHGFKDNPGEGGNFDGLFGFWL
jgi:hypothetical protein